MKIEELLYLTVNHIRQHLEQTLLACQGVVHHLVDVLLHDVHALKVFLQATNSVMYFFDIFFSYLRSFIVQTLTQEPGAGLYPLCVISYGV